MNINSIKAVIGQKAAQVSYQTNGSALRAEQPQQVKEPVITITQPKPVDPNQVANPHMELVQFVKTNLVEGKDYGTVPGIKGSFLFRQGAVKIMRHLCLRQEVTLLDKQINVTEKLISYTVKVSLISQDGVIVTEAIGAANSQESKFAKGGLSSDPQVAGMAEKRALVRAVKMLL